VTLRDELIATLNRIYFDKHRVGSLAEDLADGVLAVLEKRK
jgi:hypothetical protein